MKVIHSIINYQKKEKESRSEERQFQRKSWTVSNNENNAGMECTKMAQASQILAAGSPNLVLLVNIQSGEILLSDLCKSQFTGTAEFDWYES